MAKRFMNLYNARIRKGYTLECIAEKIGISKSAYFDKEKGYDSNNRKRDFTFTEMKKLADLFNESLDYLFEEDKGYA